MIQKDQCNFTCHKQNEGKHPTLHLTDIPKPRSPATALRFFHQGRTYLSCTPVLTFLSSTRVLASSSLSSICLVAKFLFPTSYFSFVFLLPHMLKVIFCRIRYSGKNTHKPYFFLVALIQHVCRKVVT